MKVLVLADLHYDLWPSDPLEGCEDLLEGVRAVFLAGDVAEYKDWPAALSYVREKISSPLGLPVLNFVFPGNHDYYKFYLDAEGNMQNCAEQHDFHFVQKDRIVLNGTRFLCCTLWSDCAVGGDLHENKKRISQHMNDFGQIFVHGHGKEPTRRVTPNDFIRIHEDHRAWLEKELSEPWTRGRTIVVTHHAPHPKVMRKYSLDLRAAYGSDLSHMMTGESAPDVWFYGHTHSSLEAKIGRTQIRAAGLGYPERLQDNLDLRRRKVAGMLIEV